MITEFILRKWNISDKENLVKYANNIKIAGFLTNQFPHPYTLSDAESFITRVSQDFPLRVFAIDINGEAIGSIGIFPQTDIHCKNAELGYWLAEPFWGKGIITDAIIKIVEYGFETFDIKRIYARPFGNNRASQKVLQKAGFELEAVLKNTIFKNNVFLDEFIFSVRK